MVIGIAEVAAEGLGQPVNSHELRLGLTVGGMIHPLQINNATQKSIYPVACHHPIADAAQPASSCDARASGSPEVHSVVRAVLYA